MVFLNVKEISNVKMRSGAKLATSRPRGVAQSQLPACHEEWRKAGHEGWCKAGYESAEMLAVGLT